MHAERFTDKALAAGKKVIVVGGGKSAIDCAVAAAKTAEHATLLFREFHWPVPRYLLDLVPFKWGTYSRFGHSTLPVHYDVSPLGMVLHFLASPLKWLWWRIVELSSVSNSASLAISCPKHGLSKTSSREAKS